MTYLKKLFVALVALCALAIPVAALAVSPTQSFQNIVPFVTDKFDNGTSSLRWLHVFTKYASTTALNIVGQGTGCATFDVNGLLTSTGVACGGAGASPGGSSGQLQYNGSGAFAGVSTTTLTGSGVITISNSPVLIGASPAVASLTGGSNGQVLGWLSGIPTWTATSSVAAGTGISVATAGSVNTVTNTGVTSIVAGTNVTISGATGAVTVNASGGGGTFPFTPATSWGVNTSATTTALWGQNSIFASSTSATVPAFSASNTTGPAAVFGQGNVGIATSSPYTALSVSGGLAAWAAYPYHLGTSCTTANSGGGNNGIQGLEVCGTDNTTNGVQAGLTNINNGSSAYTFFYYNNHLANGAFTSYAGDQYNSNTYSDTTFGTAFAVPDALTRINTDGPITFITSTTTGKNYQSFVIGGTAATNEIARLTTTGLGIGSTSPRAQLSIQSLYTASSTALAQYNIIGSSTPSFYVGSPNQNGFVGIGTTSSALFPLSVQATSTTVATALTGITVFNSSQNPGFNTFSAMIELGSNAASNGGSTYDQIVSSTGTLNFYTGNTVSGTLGTKVLALSTGSATFTGTVNLAATGITNNTFIVSSSTTSTIPLFQIDGSVVAGANGLLIKSSASGSLIALSTQSLNANDGISINGKGTGANTFGTLNTGATSVGNTTGASTVTGATIGLVSAGATTLGGSTVTSTNNLIAASGVYTNATTGNGGFGAGALIAFSSGAAAAPLPGSANMINRAWFNGTTATVITAGANYADVEIMKTPITEAASSNHPLLAQLAIRPMTVTAGVSTVSTTSSLYIEDAATTTVSSGGNYSIYVANGSNYFNATSTFFNPGFSGVVGIGTATPISAFTMVAASTTAATLANGYSGTVHIIAGFENTVVKLFQVIDQWGHRITGGDAPVLSACGTTPTFVGSANDNTMSIQVGSVSATSCTATFAHAWPTAPTCNVSNRSMSITNALSYTVSATAITVTQTALTSAILDVQCTGTQ